MSRFDLLFSNIKVIELCGNDCSLCNATFDSTLIATKCGHLFCVPCLHESMKDQKSKEPPIKFVCPICDTPIEKSGQSRQRLKLKIKRLAKTSQMEKDKFLKVLKLYRALKCEAHRSKPIRITITCDSDAPQDEWNQIPRSERVCAWDITKFNCEQKIFLESINFPNPSIRRISKSKINSPIYILCEQITVQKKKQTNRMALTRSMERLKVTKIYSSCCCICFENPSNELIVTKCGHLYCKQCFGAWYFTLALNCIHLEKCPLCQTNIRKPYERKFELRLEVRRLQAQTRIMRARYNRIMNLYRRLKNNKCCWGQYSDIITQFVRCLCITGNLLYKKLATTNGINYRIYSLFTNTLFHLIIGGGSAGAGCLLFQKLASFGFEFAIDDGSAFIGLFFGQSFVSLFGKIDLTDRRHNFLGIFSLPFNANQCPSLKVK